MYLKNKTEDEIIFGSLYSSCFNALCNYAEKIVRDKDVAKDVVSGVFLILWENRKHVEIESLEGYLWRSVRNNSLKYLDLEHVKSKTGGDVHNMLELYHPKDANDPLSIMETEETKQAIEEAIACLPPKCREVFQLAKLEDLSYFEVAEKLGISIKTVYKHIAIAMNKLRAIIERS